MEPRACPFCGSRRTTTGGARRYFWLFCQECGAAGPWRKSHDEARIAWNARDADLPEEFQEWLEKRNDSIG